MILISPLATAAKMSKVFGRKVVRKFNGRDARANFMGYNRETYVSLIIMCGIGILYLPAVIMMTIAMWPFVFIYRIYHVVAICLRNFICCCFC